jgi:1,4-dihydroxy-2-naphthoate polyprenyltransferase
LLAGLPEWDSEAALLAISIPPVVVGIGVAAHLHSASVAKSLGLIGAAVALAFGLGELLHRPERHRVGSTIGPVRLSAVIWLGLAAALGVWLALSSAWWLLGVGTGASAGLLILVRGPASPPVRGLQGLAALAGAEFLAGWGTIWVELGHLPLIGGLAMILPASLAAALLLLINLRDLPGDLHVARITAAVRLGASQARTLFLALLAVALAVPLLITLPGLGGAECFLPWVAAPLAEGPIRNSASPDSATRRRAVRQMEMLLAASSILLAIGIWAG